MSVPNVEERRRSTPELLDSTDLTTDTTQESWANSETEDTLQYDDVLLIRGTVYYGSCFEIELTPTGTQLINEQGTVGTINGPSFKFTIPLIDENDLCYWLTREEFNNLGLIELEWRARDPNVRRFWRA